MFNGKTKLVLITNNLNVYSIRKKFVYIYFLNNIYKIMLLSVDIMLDFDGINFLNDKV